MDGKVNEMKLPSRRRIPNANTLPLGHGGSPQYWIFSSKRGTFFLFLWNLKVRVGFEPAISSFPSRQLQPMNECGFMPLYAYNRLNWVRRTSWGWWDEWDYTTLQTGNAKFETWRSETEHATSRSRRLPRISNIYESAGKNLFSLKLEGQSGGRTREQTFQAGSFDYGTSPPPANIEKTYGEHMGHVSEQTTKNMRVNQHTNNGTPTDRRHGDGNFNFKLNNLNLATATHNFK